MTRSRRSSRYLGTITQADLDKAAAQADLELDEDERALHAEVAAWNAMVAEDRRDWDAVDAAWLHTNP